MTHNVGDKNSGEGWVWVEAESISADSLGKQWDEGGKSRDVQPIKPENCVQAYESKDGRLKFRGDKDQTREIRYTQSLSTFQRLKSIFGRQKWVPVNIQWRMDANSRDSWVEQSSTREVVYMNLKDLKGIDKRSAGTDPTNMASAVKTFLRMQNR